MAVGAIPPNVQELLRQSNVIVISIGGNDLWGGADWRSAPPPDPEKAMSDGAQSLDFPGLEALNVMGLASPQSAIVPMTARESAEPTTGRISRQPAVRPPSKRIRTSAIVPATFQPVPRYSPIVAGRFAGFMRVADAMMEDYLLSGAHFDAVPATMANETMIPIANEAGRFVAYFKWQPERPRPGPAG